MTLRAGLLALFWALFSAAGTVSAAGGDEALLRCRALQPDDARLRCYDAIAVGSSGTSAQSVHPAQSAQSAKSTWSGRNGTDDFSFTARPGDELLIDHDDAILVGTLKDDAGNQLENLHMAGRGTLRVVPPGDGDYTVTLSATGNWTARLHRAP